MSMRILTTLLLLAGVAIPSVDYDRDVDFSRYHTWAWSSDVTHAMDATTENRIREAIENGLAAHGLSRVEKDAALLVVYHASKTTQIDLVPVGKSDPSNKTGIQYAEKGSLVLEMREAASGRVVWRGHATGVLRYGPPEIAAQIKAAVDGLLANFPPPASSPAR